MSTTTVTMEICTSRLFLAGIVEDNIGWIKIRNLVQLLENDIANIAEKWQDFNIVTPLILSGSVAFMGSFSKDNRVPDETFTRPFPSVDEKKLDDLYLMCDRLDLELNPTKNWKGVSSDPNIYNYEVNEGIQLWTKIAEIYLQIQDILYMLRARKFFCCNFSNYEKIHEVVGRTPGQITQTFPNTVSILIRTPNQPVRLKRLKNKLGQDYLGWLYRDELKYIQEDPEDKLNIRILEFNNAISFPTDPGAPPEGYHNTSYRFPVHLQSNCDENDVLMGFNSMAAAYSKDVIDPVGKDYEPYELMNQSFNYQQFHDPELPANQVINPVWQDYSITWNDDLFSDVILTLIPNSLDLDPLPDPLPPVYPTAPEEFQNQGIVLKVEPYNV